MNEIVLEDSDPTVFAKCPKCCAHYNGKLQGNYFAKAYPRKKWARGQVCENCGTEMQFMYEVK